jgi:hypothetical protein
MLHGTSLTPEEFDSLLILVGLGYALRRLEVLGLTEAGKRWLVAGNSWALKS